MSQIIFRIVRRVASAALPVVLLTTAGGFLPGLTPIAFALPTSYSTVVLSGDAAPGAAPGVNFRTFNTPVINGSGQTAFRSILTGPGVTPSNDSGVYSEGGGAGLAQVARTGDAAPGTAPGVKFRFINGPILNEAGQAVFSATLTGTGVNGANDRAIFFEGGGGAGLALVAREGDNAPGTAPGVNFREFRNLVFNEAGQVAFHGFLTGNGVNIYNNSGVFSEGGGAGLALVARAGDAAPGTAAGVNFGNLSSLNNLAFNGSGQTVFTAGLTGTGLIYSNTGIFSEGGGSGLALVAREGYAVPGTTSGLSFSFISTVDSPALNGSGQIAFVAGISGPGVNRSSNAVIFSDGGGAGFALVAREGDAVPGLPGVSFSSLNNPVLNAAGQTAFSAGFTDVNGSTGFGIFSEGGGSGLAMVAGSGDNAPGTAAGVNFNSFFDPALNGAGQTAFTARLTGTGVNFSNNFGLWATDPDGLLSLIVRTGDLFDVDDDPLVEVFRTIIGVKFFGGSGGEDGRFASFNDAGQLAFGLRFSDGSSGIFIANTAGEIVSAIPEPVSMALLGLGGFALLARLGGRRTAG